jgi:hypothetical protein
MIVSIFFMNKNKEQMKSNNVQIDRLGDVNDTRSIEWRTALKLDNGFTLLSTYLLNGSLYGIFTKEEDGKPSYLDLD